MQFVTKLVSFVAALMLVASSALADGHGKSHTIVDVASSNADFSTLVTALKAAGLVDTLNGEGPFTVFAPTNEAFAALPEGALEGLLADPQALANVLTLHVVAGEAEAADLVGVTEVASVQGEMLAVNTTDGVTVGGANVVQADIEASNGVVHVIDRVILP